MSLSRAKFDTEADFEPHFPVGPQKLKETYKKLDFQSKNFAEENAWRRKMKGRESSETGFPKVSCRSGRSLGGKRPFKV